jgi:hypothetical protein
MLYRTSLLSLALLATVPAAADGLLDTLSEIGRKITGGAAPPGGAPCGVSSPTGGGTTSPSGPSSISCEKSFNPFFNTEAYRDQRASDEKCNPSRPPPSTGPATPSTGPAKLNNDVIQDAKIPTPPPIRPKSTDQVPASIPSPPFQEPESTFPKTYDPAELTLRILRSYTRTPRRLCHSNATQTARRR